MSLWARRPVVRRAWVRRSPVPSVRAARLCVVPPAVRQCRSLVPPAVRPCRPFVPSVPPAVRPCRSFARPCRSFVRGAVRSPVGFRAGAVRSVARWASAVGPWCPRVARRRPLVARQPPVSPVGRRSAPPVPPVRPRAVGPLRPCVGGRWSPLAGRACVGSPVGAAMARGHRGARGCRWSCVGTAERSRARWSSSVGVLGLAGCGYRLRRGVRGCSRVRGLAGSRVWGHSGRSVARGLRECARLGQGARWLVGSRVCWGSSVAARGRPWALLGVLRLAGSGLRGDGQISSQAARGGPLRRAAPLDLLRDSRGRGGGLRCSEARIQRKAVSGLWLACHERPHQPGEYVPVEACLGASEACRWGVERCPAVRGPWGCRVRSNVLDPVW